MLEARSENLPDRFACLAAERTSDAVAITDSDGIVVWANPAFFRLTGIDPVQLVSGKIELLRGGPDTDASHLAEISRAFAEQEATRVEIFAYSAQKRGYWAQISLDPIFGTDGEPSHFVAIKREVTERRSQEDNKNRVVAEDDTQQFERKLLAQTSEWLYSAKSMDELLSVTKRAIAVMMPEVTGYMMTYAEDRETLELAVGWGDEAHPRQMTADDCWALRRGRAYQYGRGMIEVACAHVDDDTAPYFCFPLVADGETIGLLHLSFPAIPVGDAAAGAYDEMLDRRWEIASLCAEQISLAIANVRLRMELHDQSVRDQLTGLWNRRWFLDAARKELARCQTAGQPFGLISLDVDHFKRFNDQYGHDAGDAVLRTVGKLLLRYFAIPYSPCRLGGEEFVVICPNMDADACYEAAEMFRDAMQQATLRHAGRDLPPITTSQGVAVSDVDHPLDLLDQLKLSDNALYAAKTEGRNRTVLHRTEAEPMIWDDVATG